MDKCQGCGSIIQFVDESNPGFINEEVYKRRKEENKEILCERCFRLKHYNEVKKVTIDEENFLNLVKNNVTNNMLICYIVDLFDLCGSLIKNINDIFPHNEILVIGNKYDLFMRSNRPTKLKKYLNDYLIENNISASGIVITNGNDIYSAKKVYETIVKMVDAKKLSREVFFFGMSNSGKTTLLKSMGSAFNVDSAKDLIVSKAISTTLGLNKITINELNIIDSPGLVNEGQVTYYLNKKTIDYIMPKDVIKPVVFQLNLNQTIFIEGFAKVSLLNSDNKKTSLIFNVANNIKLHRTKYDASDEFYKKHLNDLFVVPNKQERARLGELKSIIFDLSSEDEIALAGIGFIAVNGNARIEIKTFEKIQVEKRKKLI